MMEKRITAKKLPAKEVKADNKKERLAKKARLEAAAEAKVVPAGPPVVNLKTFDFPIGTKYMTGNVLYTVIRLRKDSNTEWRTVISATHGDQDYMLETLIKDAKADPNFVVVEIGNVANAHG